MHGKSDFMRKKGAEMKDSWRRRQQKEGSMGRNVSVLIGKSIPQIPKKCKDPGTFYIPCIIGNNKFENAMLDLGASVYF